LPEPATPEPGATPGEVLRGVDPLPSGADGLVCSSKGCRAAATTDLQWNNPKIHTPDRRKHWLACDEHRATLASFLSVRGFLRDTQGLDPRQPDGPTG
jgi:hypothetical protein